MQCGKNSQTSWTLFPWNEILYSSSFKKDFVNAFESSINPDFLLSKHYDKLLFLNTEDFYYESNTNNQAN